MRKPPSLLTAGVSGRHAVWLVCRLLQRDPRKRLTAAQALAHGWLEPTLQAPQQAQQGPSSRQLVQRLRDFTHRTRLQVGLASLVDTLVHAGLYTAGWPFKASTGLHSVCRHLGACWC